MGRYASRPRTWTLERVVAEIRALHAGGELGSTAELTHNGHGALVSAAHRYAGTWEKAMRLAGVNYEAPRRWTRESVVREIRRLHRAGKSVHATGVETALRIAARRQFGSWRKARAAALPAHGNPYETWTQRKLLAELAALHERGVPLTASGLRSSGRGRLINASVRAFGTWTRARRRALAGFVPGRRTWTDRDVLRAIQERYRRAKSMSSNDLRRDDSGLLAAATRLYGSWPAARKAANVPYRDPRRRWTGERVLAELRRRAPGRQRPTIAQIGQALYKVAIARFGNFDRACRMAGLVDPTR